jgi:hypothetical protein
MNSFLSSCKKHESSKELQTITGCVCKSLMAVLVNNDTGFILHLYLYKTCNHWQVIDKHGELRHPPYVLNVAREELTDFICMGNCNMLSFESISLCSGHSHMCSAALSDGIRTLD